MSKLPSNTQKTVNTETAIESAIDSINHLHKIIKECVENMALEKYEDSFKQMEEIYSILDLVVVLIRQIVSTEHTFFKENATIHQNLNFIEVHLLGVIKALVTAKEKKDYVMVSDLLEYELTDNLTQWKIKILLEISKYRAQKLEAQK